MRSMKAGLLALAMVATALFLSCSNHPLNSHGEVTYSQFRGKFHGVSIYLVELSNGNMIYVGVIEDDSGQPVITGEPKLTTVALPAKSPEYTVVLNGVKMNKDDAIKAIVNESVPGVKE